VGRSGLSRRERCLATFAVDVIAGMLGAPFEAHVRLWQDASISTDELRAALRILAESSIPKAWEALITFEGLLTDHRSPISDTLGGIISKTKSPNHVTTISKVEVANISAKCSTTPTKAVWRSLKPASRSISPGGHRHRHCHSSTS
jgi:hypothetical protein